MISLKRFLPRIKLRFFLPSKKRLTNDTIYRDGKRKTRIEKAKTPLRTEIINYLISFLNRDITYLEIGVRNPADNFDHIKANVKYSVDPGIEFEENPVDFQMTSDEFFENLTNGKVLDKNLQFDLIFIDGLHLADQVDKDIVNAFRFLKKDGFIIMHDCNPPTEWHAREDYYYVDTPAGSFWNGTTWKAFLKWRSDSDIYSCCIDTDWGVGILTKGHNIGSSANVENSFYEYYILNENRKEFLNLISFDELKKKLEN